MTNCAITECRDYTENELDSALRKIIENTAFPKVEGKTVFVKPNILSDASPEKAITTDYRALDAFLRILKEKGAEKIIVGDSPGTQTGKLNANQCRISEVVKKHDATLSDFREENRIHEIDGIKIPMAKALDEADVVISFAKFKTHQLMSATGAVKNMFGTIPGLNKSPMHFRYRTPESFAAFLMKIFDECHVDYAFLDGVIGMEGPGPGRSADGTAGTASEAARPDAAHLTPASVRLDGGVDLRGSREKANFSPSERRAEMGLFDKEYQWNASMTVTVRLTTGQSWKLARVIADLTLNVRADG